MNSWRINTKGEYGRTKTHIKAWKNAEQKTRVVFSIYKEALF